MRRGAIVVAVLVGALSGASCAVWKALAGTTVEYTGPQGASLRVILPSPGASAAEVVVRSSLDGGMNSDAERSVVGVVVVDCPHGCALGDAGGGDQ